VAACFTCPFFFGHRKNPEQNIYKCAVGSTEHMVRHCIPCAERHHSTYVAVEYLEMHKIIDKKIKDLFVGIDLSSKNNKDQLEHAISCISKLRFKKPVRIVKPSSNSPTVLSNTILAYKGSQSKPEFRWVCLKCSLNTDEVSNPFFVSGPAQNHGVF